MREDTIILPMLEVLEPRLLLSGSTLESALGDFGNSLSEATEIIVQADQINVVSGEIASRYDSDYLKFTAPVSGGVQIAMEAAEGSDLDALLLCYNESGRRVAFSNNVSRYDTDALVNFYVEAGQTYYARALGRRTTGEYDLSLSFSEDLDANLRSEATALTVATDTTTTRSGSIDYVRDVDYFTFEATDSGGLTLGMGADGSNVNSYLTLYNADGRRLASNNNVARGNPDSELTLAVQAGETYYVCAKALGRSTTAFGAYQLQFDLTVDEDGNSFDNATALTLNADATTTVSGGIEYQRDYDFFTFTAEGDGGVTVRMAAQNSSVDSLLFLYNADGRRIAVNNNYSRANRDAQTSILVEDGQTYYIRAIGLGRSTGAYQLQLQHSLDEQGDTRAEAQQIQVDPAGTTVNGGIDYRFDRDYFSFVASDTGGMTVNMNAVNGSNLDCMLYVYNDSGRRIAYNDDIARGQTNSEASFYVEAGQTYYVQAQGWRHTQGDYELTFLLSVDDQGPNPSGAGTVTLDENGNATVNSSLDYRYDVDCFSFSAAQSTDMSIRMHDVDASIRPLLVVSNAAGRRVTQGTSYYGGSTTVGFNTVAGQTYYVRVASLSRGQGDYTLTFDLSVDDHSNEQAGATVLNVSAATPTQVSGEIDYAYDRDYFTFTAAQTGGMAVTMDRATGSSLDAYLTIRNASGSILTYNDDVQSGNLNSAVCFYVEAGTTYYVQAGAYGTSQGAYDMELTLSPDEYGGSIATAGTLNLNEDGAGSMDGTLNFGGDNDYVAFTATHTATMTLSLSKVGGTVRPMLAIYSSSGQLLSTGVGTSTVPASASFTATAGATYYARAYSVSSVDTGDYRLAVQTDIPAPPPEPNPDVPDPTPGAVVTATVYNTGSGMLLRIVGTSNNDVIVVSQTAGSVSVTGSLSYNYNNAVNSIELYGFGGNDVLRTTYSVTSSALLYGGDGADTIYENGQGQGVSYGQAGDDLIVSVGGGRDTVLGGVGLDSVWADSTDILFDTSSAEISARSVHRISSFNQPYTTNPASSDYVSLEIAGQNFRDPTVTSYANRYENFSHLDVFNNGPQYSDINQGAVGDCYFLAAVSSLAQTDPTILRQMITSLGDGTYAVRYYSGSNEVYLRIDGDLPVYSGGSLTYAKTSDTNEIWVPLIEKAYAHFRYGQDSYASISGGWMDTVYRQVTGLSATFRYTSGTTSSLASYLRDNLSAGHAVTLGSYSNASSPVVGSHAYQVVSVDANNYVTVYNPWGVDGRSWDSNYGDGLLRLSINQVQANYVGICVSLA